MKLTFNKEIDGRWYVDLPHYDGPKEDLEMVDGADNMMEVLSNRKSIVTLKVRKKPWAGAYLIKLERVPSKEEMPKGGAFYKFAVYKGIHINLSMWLCDVVKFIFNEFPEKIYFTVIEND